MKKISFLLVIMLVLSLVIVGCSDNNTETANDNELANEEPIAEKVDVVIAGLKGPTSIGMIKLIDEASINNDNPNYNVSYVIEGAPDALIGKIINGEVQIAAVPTNLASVLYNKTEGQVQFLALNTLGVIHIVGTENITSLEELEGETLYISGKGATPDYAINYILQQKGLIDKIDLDFSLDHSSLAQAVIAGDAPVAVLPQPFVTQVMMKNKDVKLLIDLNKEWNEIDNGNSTLAMGCLVVNKEFAENNKKFIAEFLQDYEASVNWVNENPSDAGILVEKNGVLPNAKLAELAIPNCSIVYQNANDSKDIIDGFLKVLYDFNPLAVGGKLPGEGFYYSE